MSQHGHWAVDLIGKRWSADGRESGTFSCWSLVRHALRLRGVDLPENPVEALRGACAAVDAREDDVVLMRNGIGAPHSGLLVRANGRLGMLHASHAAGVVWEPFGDAVSGMRYQIWRPTQLVREGDAIEWHGLPQDKEDFRSILQIAAIIVSFVPGLQPFAAYVYAANVAYNILVPPTLQTQRRPEQTGENFTTGLNGNEARLDQPIPKICGRREVTPPFAGQPYSVFLPKAGAADPNLDNDQYFYALYAVGIGNHDVVAKIANTSISRFADVLVAQYLPPGTPPSTVEANVTTAPEVSGQVLDSGLYVGGFAACAPGRTCSAIGIDILATRGLGKTAALSVSWRVEYRTINDFGQVLSAWALLGSDQARTAFTSTPQPWSVRYELGTAARVEIRVVRTDLKDTDPAALHEIAWTGLRAYLAEAAPLNPNCAHFEIVMRASKQLSNFASHDLRLIVKAYARTLDSNLDWQAEEHTRNPVWWILDLATSDTWGINKPDDRVDLQSFYDLAQTAAARQDNFDWVFESTMNAWDAMQLIARSCRSRVFRRNGVLSIARDEIADLPVTAFTPRNCQPGMSVDEKLRNRKSPDGIVIEYQDHRTWEWTPIECPVPGIDLSDMVNPVHIRLEGVSGATHAEREGLYEAANLLYRPRVSAWTTELQGMLPAYMSPVDFLPDIQGYGHSGDVAFWDDANLVLGLTEPPDWSAGALYLTLIRDDGSLTDDVLVTPGPTEWDVTLPAAPDFDLVLDDAARERPKYLLGTKDLVKVVSITDGGKTGDGAQLFNLSGVIDDERVHTADIHLLPGPGDIQDEPLDSDDDASGGGAGGLILVDINDGSIGGTGNLGVNATYTLKNDGTIHSEMTVAGATTDVSSLFLHQWMRFGAVELTTASLYEVRFTLMGSVNPGVYGGSLTATLDTWLPLSADQSITVDYPIGAGDGYELYAVRVEIREIASGIVQDTCEIDAVVSYTTPP